MTATAIYVLMPISKKLKKKISEKDGKNINMFEKIRIEFEALQCPKKSRNS